MRAVIQRVAQATVTVDEKIISQIKKGLLVLIGIEEQDTKEDVVWLSSKIVNLRIFADENQLMNRSLKDVEGEVMVVSQFTLHASTKKGNRPSYMRAAKPNVAKPLYECFVQHIQTDLGKPIATGIFGADMKITLLNDGPVTIFIDTKNKE